MNSNEQPCPDTYWLPGASLAAGPHPGFDVETIRMLLDAGIRAFIDLTEERELDSYEVFLEEEAAQRDIDVSYSRFAIRDGHAPDRDLMERILDAVADAHTEERAVYVHCWGGIGRTGTVAGCWLVEQGYSSDDALDLVQSLYKKYRRPSAHFPRSPETNAQHAFVRRWSKRSESTP
ncbi:MAG: protein-tyrosine phosphatase family protein [Gemmatimonadaceae bacterium]